MSSLNVVLKSPRLHISVADSDDAVALYNFHVENKEHFAPWDPPYPEGFFSLSYWQNYCLRAQSEFSKKISARYLLWHDGELAGSVNATNFEYGPFQNARIGYKVGALFQGKGLAKEGVTTVVNELFRFGFHRVEANYRPENVRSSNLLKALNFIEIGLAPNYLLIDGKWRDHILTAKTKSKEGL